MAFAILLDVGAFVALPLVIWHLTRGVVPLAVLPILIGMGLSVAGARLGIGHPIAATALGDLAGWLGVLLLAFAAGLEARPLVDGSEGGPNRGTGAAANRSLWRMLDTALVALALPFVVGTALAYGALPHLDGWQPAGTDRLLAAAGIGLCLAVSALPVLVGIVRELSNPDHRRLGRLAVRIAAADDVALWVGLGVLILLSQAGRGFGAWGWPDLAAAALIALLAAGRRLLDGSHRRPPAWLAWGIAALYLAAGAWSTTALGLHALIGAYLAGVLTPLPVAARLPAERLAFFALAALAPLFFGHRGLGIDGGVFGFAALVAALVLFALSALAKTLAVLLVPPLPAMPRSERLALGALLQCKGLMEIVAATILRDQGILSDTGYAVLITLAVISTAATKPLFARFAGAARRSVEAAESPPGAE
ncbi:MAG: cation:proton antiporter [Rhodospirillales bacterium]